MEKKTSFAARCMGGGMNGGGGFNGASSSSFDGGVSAFRFR